MKEISLLEKIQIIRGELLESMTKSGNNNYSHYDYFQLKDFIPKIIELCNKHKVYTKFYMDYEKVELPSQTATTDTFNEDGILEKQTQVISSQFELKEYAYLVAVNLDNVEEKEVYKKETGNVRIQGAQDIQNLGGKSTYMKRYMYMDMFEIVESDIVEENTGKPVKAEVKTTKSTQSKPVTKTVATKQVETPKAEVTEEETEVIVSDDIMTMDHKVELANYMKENGLDPKATIVDAAKSLGVDVPMLKESHFEEIKKYVDEKVGK